MGTTSEIKETNIGSGLIGKTCSRCDKKFTEKDICEDSNWEVQFDTSNDVKLEENKVKGYGYNLTIWIRNAYHEFCDEAEEVIEEEKQKAELAYNEKLKKTGFSGEAIDVVMSGLEEAQRKHVERMEKLTKKNDKK